MFDVEKILGLQSAAVSLFVLLELVESSTSLVAGQGDAVDVCDGVQKVVSLVNDDNAVLQTEA